MDTGSDFQGFAGVGKAHQVEVVTVHVFEITLGSVEEGFGQVVLTVAQGFGAGSRIEEFFTLHGAFGFGILLRPASGAGFDATPPIEVMGPAFDGAQGGADFSADGRIAAPGTEFEVGAEGFGSAGGFAFGLREEGEVG